MASSPNSKVRTLERAAVAFGDAQHLATFLNVELTQVADWLAGHVEIPPEVFAAALDVVAAGPFVSWRANGDARRAQRHANQLQEIADRIKASAMRAQRIADQAKLNADRSTALAQVQRVLENAQSERYDQDETVP
jgi:hypothetical protein